MPTEPNTPLLDDTSWTPERRAMLQLVSMGRFTAKTLYRLNAFVGTRDLRAIGVDTLPLTPLQRTQWRQMIRNDLSPMLHTMATQGIRFVLPGDPEFPVGFGKMIDPPFALFVRGRPLTNGMRISIVGTRKMTPYGQRATALLSRELTQHGATIVSGLAFGVDLEAHQACVEAGGNTIAVLAGGIDDAAIMPPAHVSVAHRFLAQGVATLLSEYPPGFLVQRFHYLLRNRLIAALSEATIVTEADHESGALVTARLGLDDGREVLAVPGDIFLPTCRGTNALIASGAKPCRNAEDVLSALGFCNATLAKEIATARQQIPMDPAEQRILDVLHLPRSVDELSRHLQEPIAQITACISLLELKGRIVSVGPRTYVAQ